MPENTPPSLSFLTGFDGRFEGGFELTRGGFDFPAVGGDDERRVAGFDLRSPLLPRRISCRRTSRPASRFFGLSSNALRKSAIAASVLPRRLLICARQKYARSQRSLRSMAWSQSLSRSSRAASAGRLESWSVA